MIREIVKYPDPILQKPAEPVTEFNDELRSLVDDMFESMYAAQGIGLAAPQIGISKRITVIDLSFKKNPEEKIVLINPEITYKQGKQNEDEGCLSLPEIREKVSRAEKSTRPRTGRNRKVVRNRRGRIAGSRISA